MDVAANPTTRLIILISSESDVLGKEPIRINDEQGVLPEMKSSWPERRLLPWTAGPE